MATTCMTRPGAVKGTADTYRVKTRKLPGREAKNDIAAY